MNSYVFGFICSILVTVAPIFLMAKNRLIFISLEGIFVVIGGTIAIALSSYPMHKIKKLMAGIRFALTKEVDQVQLVATEIIEFARKTGGDRTIMAQEVNSLRHPFFKDGVHMLIDKLDTRVEAMLLDRIRTKQEEDQGIVEIIKSLARFPPALGLLATVLSLVTLLEGMGGGQLGAANIGPAMAIGLVGTLYGIVMANLFFAPLAENLAMKSALETKNRQLIFIGVVLLLQRESSIAVQESVNSLLQPSHQVDVLGINRGQAGQNTRPRGAA